MKKKYWAAALIIFLILCMAFVVCHFLKLGKAAEDISSVPESTASETEELTNYESPIDFVALKKRNPDVYGWLEIPGTNISYPVLQSAEDDNLYLRHDIDKKYYVGGALFTEHVYNSNDFSDPVTIIYGHHLTDGTMFADLQQLYTDDFEKYKDIVIYTPAEEIHYEAFAAVPFSNRHILYYYDCFKEEIMMHEFMNDLSNVRAIGSYLDKSVEVTSKDQLIILSTCLQGDRTSRFLVIGKRIDQN